MISFKPFSKKTVSVPKTFQVFSKDKNINIKSIDFTLVSYETFIRRKGVSEDIILKDTTTIQPDILLSPDARVYQRYEINIFPSELDISTYNISLSSNVKKTKMIATIAAGTVFSSDKNLEKNLKDFIWKKKLLSGFLIGVFEEEFEKQLKKLLEILPYGKKLPKDIKFVVAQGIESIECVHSEIEKVYLYKKQNERNYIDGVELGELILRYQKHKNGLGGRSCEGKYLDPGKPTILKVPKTDKTIQIKEDEHYIEFYANESGYVSYENDFLSISKTLKLESATFKTTGDLDAGELNDEISVTIEHSKGTYEDAIGGGLKIDVKGLSSNGSIGSNTQISACELSLEAQTHKKSSLAIKNKANIKLHRGDLLANEAQIEVLETGKVKAHKTVHVKKMIGGEIIAPKVYIDELVSNGKITASELIEIKSISGDHNTLIINPNQIEGYHQAKEQLQRDILQRKKNYQEDQKTFESKLQEHNEQIQRMQTFQRRVNEAKISGKTPMKQDILRIKEYKRKSETFTQQQQKLLDEKKELEMLELQLTNLLEQDLHAKIITNSLYDGHTKVIFINPMDATEISLLPHGQAKTITLELDKNGQRVIKTTA
ncbi:flagellar assembly protein A [Sulfurimonas sp.]|uniref:flagellar assembly protein A n=1 Tax=Sulfurimonas sp. TaxID=2022749 RepID=UPI003D0ADA17